MDYDRLLAVTHDIRSRFAAGVPMRRGREDHRGRIWIDRIDRRWLKQAYAERKLLERITGMRVEALLVFSDAYLVGSVPAHREGVTILPARMLAGFLERRRPDMSAAAARELAERLANAVA